MYAVCKMCKCILFLKGKETWTVYEHQYQQNSGLLKIIL